MAFDRAEHMKKLHELNKKNKQESVKVSDNIVDPTFKLEKSPSLGQEKKHFEHHTEFSFWYDIMVACAGNQRLHSAQDCKYFTESMVEVFKKKFNLV